MTGDQEDRSRPDRARVRDLPRVLVIGSGWMFTSGISYYTCTLANELASSAEVSVLTMRRLVPVALYPGRARVGLTLNELDYAPGVTVQDGVDWYWGRSMLEGQAFLDRRAPDLVVLQWWTGAVLHSYLRLARRARRRGARVVLECHEMHDTGEARIPLVGRYVRHGLRRLLALCDGVIVHSEFDRDQWFPLLASLDLPVAVAPHGPYAHVGAPLLPPSPRRDPDGPVNLLFFGTIRPYKGLEDLIQAFCSMPAEEVSRYRLTVIGETWEGWDEPLERLATCRKKDRVHVINRYVTDAEARDAFATADVVVLPYLRSSSSGPLHMAMAAGLPVVVSDVGGLAESVSGYRGAVLVPPADPGRLLEGIRRARALVGQRFADPRDWSVTRDAVLGFMPLPGDRQPRS